MLEVRQGKDYTGVFNRPKVARQRYPLIYGLALHVW
jgi:hypothetical protein